ncbi:unnamed protein product [Paramecium pentaurelia]|uniref:Uncharacterized protein n=1 Tax=Paramecium pentaurelia TaxID=43138 RepID=A0A8S1V002_9CILI|nr:unnamed protein product [Paramecium pentaurelia]
MNKKNKNSKKESISQTIDKQSKVKSLAELEITQKLVFLRKILWTWLIWQSVIVLSCFLIYSKLPFLSSVQRLIDSDLLLMFFLCLTVILLYFGSSNIKQKEQKTSQLYLISVIITQTLLYSLITNKLVENSINFLLIHCMQLIVIANLILYFRNAIEINHLIYFKQMFWYSGFLIAAEFFFTKSTSINTIPGMIVIGSILGFGTFALRSIETLIDGKFNLNQEQTSLGSLLAYTNLLLPYRKSE